MNPVTSVVAGVKTPLNWAKARPFVFLGLVLLVAVLAIKYAAPFLAGLGKVPLVGGKVVAFAQPAAGA